MEWIIIFNYESRDVNVAVNAHGFIESFSSYESAEQVAKDCIDGTDYRSFEIFETAFK